MNAEEYSDSFIHFWRFYLFSQGKGDSFASDFLPYLFWVLASSLCPKKTPTPSWWTPLTTAMARWLHTTTNFPQPVRAAAPPMPMTPVPLLPLPITLPPYLGLWITPHLRVPGTGYTRTKLWPRPSIRAKRTRSMQLHLSQVLHQLPLERACVVSDGPPLCMIWKGLDPIPKRCSGTDMPVKVWFILTVVLAIQFTCTCCSTKCLYCYSVLSCTKKWTDFFEGGNAMVSQML